MTEVVVQHLYQCGVTKGFSESIQHPEDKEIPEIVDFSSLDSCRAGNTCSFTRNLQVMIGLSPHSDYFY